MVNKMNEIKKLRKKIEKEAEETFEINEDSDIPVHERYVKEKKIKKIR